MKPLVWRDLAQATTESREKVGSKRHVFVEGWRRRRVLGNIEMTNTTPDKFTIELCVAMNEDGDYAVDAWGANGNAVENLREYYGFTACRLVKLAVTMRPPVAAKVRAVEVKDDAGEVIAEAAE
jgi:hypothetical protein